MARARSPAAGHAAVKLAFLTTRLFEHPCSGGEICTGRLVDALRADGHELRCIGRGVGAADAGDIGIGPLVGPFDELHWPRRAQTLGLAMATGRPCTVQRLSGGGAARRARRALQGLVAGGLDALVIDHLQAFDWLGQGCSSLPLLLVMHNVESDGYLRRARCTAPRNASALLRRHVLRREAAGLREMERLALARADAVACLSDADARRLRELLPPGARAPAIEVLPGLPALGMSPAPAAAADGIRRIGLIGTWTWGPNRDALDWMLREVLPRLPQGCRLVLAGSGLQAMELPPRVRSLGRVEAAEAFYREVDLVAVPSLHGSGVQEKAIEALGSGRTVVATPHALRGLGPQLPPQVHAAADADAFARMCAEAALDTPGAGAAIEAWAAERRLAYELALSRLLAVLQRGHAGPQAAASARVSPATA